MFEPKSGVEYFEVSVMTFKGREFGVKTLSENFETEAEALARYNEIVANTDGQVCSVDELPVVPVGLYSTEFKVGNDTVVEVSVNDWYCA